jgi:hypothetical protein
MTLESQTAFPSQGKVDCAVCFSMPGETVSVGVWRFRNDPGHWGSSNPRILVLGFSKDVKQGGVDGCGSSEHVAFAGARQRLKLVLQTLSLLPESEDLDRKFREDEKDFAFAFLVRCAMARLDGRGRKSITRGPKLLEVFHEGEPKRLLANCSERFLRPLPERLKLILMLGIEDQYIEECHGLMTRLYPGQITRINAVAYANSRTTWVHVSNPSWANGWFNSWLSGEGLLGNKRELARQALSKMSF